MDLRVTEEYIPDVLRAVEIYGRHGDTNPLHYFTPGESKLHELVRDSHVRFVPGATLAIAIHNHHAAQEMLETTHPQSRIFQFKTPVLFDNKGNLLYNESRPRHGFVTVENGEGVSEADLRWAQEDLYHKIGSLWRERGEAQLEEGNVLMVKALTICTDLPRDIVESLGDSAVYENYRRGQIAFQPMPLKLFGRLMRGYLGIQP